MLHNCDSIASKLRLGYLKISSHFFDKYFEVEDKVRESRLGKVEDEGLYHFFTFHCPKRSLFKLPHRGSCCGTAAVERPTCDQEVAGSKPSWVWASFSDISLSIYKF